MGRRRERLRAVVMIPVLLAAAGVGWFGYRDARPRASVAVALPPGISAAAATTVLSSRTVTESVIAETGVTRQALSRHLETRDSGEGVLGIAYLGDDPVQARSVARAAGRALLGQVAAGAQAAAFEDLARAQDALAEATAGIETIETLTGGADPRDLRDSVAVELADLEQRRAQAFVQGDLAAARRLDPLIAERQTRLFDLEVLIGHHEDHLEQELAGQADVADAQQRLQAATVAARQTEPGGLPVTDEGNVRRRLGFARSSLGVAAVVVALALSIRLWVTRPAAAPVVGSPDRRERRPPLRWAGAARIRRPRIAAAARHRRGEPVPQRSEPSGGSDVRDAGTPAADVDEHAAGA